MIKALLIGMCLPVAVHGQAPMELVEPTSTRRQMKQLLIGQMVLPLTSPEVLMASASVHHFLPCWKVRVPNFATKRELPVQAVTIRCVVEAEDGLETWEFQCERNGKGQVRLRAARMLD